MKATANHLSSFFRLSFLACQQQVAYPGSVLPEQVLAAVKELAASLHQRAVEAAAAAVPLVEVRLFRWDWPTRHEKAAERGAIIMFSLHPCSKPSEKVSGRHAATQTSKLYCRGRPTAADNCKRWQVLRRANTSHRPAPTLRMSALELHSWRPPSKR